MIRKLFVLFVVFVAAISGLVAVVPAAAQAQDFEAYSASADLAEPHADIFRLYWAFFDREPEVEGAKYWVGEYDKCASLLDITWSFSSSPEFRTRYSTPGNEQYVDLVYANVLNRTPDEAGKQYWLSLLDSGELLQAEVMLYFSAGPEFRRLYPLPSDGRTYGGCSAPVSVTTTTAPPVTVPVLIPPGSSSTPGGGDITYANCAAVVAAGAAPILDGDPGYRPGLDRDGDGIGCES